MTLDEQLRRAFDTLSDRLRDEMSRQVQAIADELAATARERERAADEDHARALDAARRQATDEARAAAEQEHERLLEEARDRALAEGRQRALDEAQRAVEAARTQALEEGREQALEDARRMAAQDAEARAARERDAAADAGRPERHLLERIADGVRALDRARTLGEVLDTLASCAARDAARVAVLVVRAGGFQTWRLMGFGRLDEGGTLEMTSADAGLIAEACSAGAIRGDATRSAMPMAIGGSVVAVLYAEADSASPLSTNALDILARHAARSLESMTAFKAARAVVADAGAARTSAQASGVAPDDTADGDDADDEGAAARRYARLLVSEIKLYHEADVLAGRRDRDLAARLGGEIARARALYEQRVAPQMRERADYFHDELVRTLANGDATLLQLT